MAIEAQRRAIDEKAEIDEFWCVFDVEWPTNHPGLKDAMRLANQNSVKLAVSNPCFELFLILHFQDQSGWLDNHDAFRLRQSLDGSTGKGLDAGKYMPLTAMEARRAAKLDNLHLQNATPFPDNNPSSGMYRLLRTVEIS